MVRGKKMAAACANLLRMTAYGIGQQVLDRMGT
jgi:hypothetical protein